MLHIVLLVHNVFMVLILVFAWVRWYYYRPADLPSEVIITGHRVLIDPPTMGRLLDYLCKPYYYAAVTQHQKHMRRKVQRLIHRSSKRPRRDGMVWLWHKEYDAMFQVYMHRSKVPLFLAVFRVFCRLFKYA